MPCLLYAFREFVQGTLDPRTASDITPRRASTSRKMTILWHRCIFRNCASTSVFKAHRLGFSHHMTLDNLIAGNAAFGSNEECNVALADRCSCQAERFRHSVANRVKLERIDATMPSARKRMVISMMCGMSKAITLNSDGCH